MCKDNIFPEKNNGFQALPGADFLPWPYSAAEKNDYFCDHKIESTMIRQYAGLVKFAHTIFAMPFALIGFVYALRTEGIPSDWCGQIRLGGAALAGVALHGLRPQRRDGLQPLGRPPHRSGQSPHGRPRNPAGKISARAALRFVIVNALLFVVTASTINLLTGLLSPVALFVILIYSYCKRFTALAHLVLGLGLGIAPVGAYIAVTGHFAWPPCILALLVMTWCGGFDIIYALQDADFDRKNGLYSIPARFSARVSLLFSILLHVVSVAALFWFGSYCPQNGWLWLGEGIFTLILVAEHLLVTPTRQRNIGIAFGTLNGIASTVLAVFVITALLRG